MGTIEATGITGTRDGIRGAGVARFGTWLVESLAVYGSSVGAPPGGDVVACGWVEAAAAGAEVGTPGAPCPRRTPQQMRYRSASWRHPFRRR